MEENNSELESLNALSSINQLTNQNDYLHFESDISLDEFFNNNYNEIEKSIKEPIFSLSDSKPNSSFFPSEICDSNEKEKESKEISQKKSTIKFLVKKDMNYSQSTFNQLSRKKRNRGKKRAKNFEENENRKIHDIYSTDNILRKIQVHYLNFIILFINILLKNLNYSEEFFKLDYEFKKNIKKEFLESLKKQTLGEIISNKISIKYKKYDKNINKTIYEKIKENEILNNILSENYIKFFKKIYYKSYYNINLKEYGLDKEIILSKKVKMYKDFLKDNKESGEKYIKYIKECTLKNFLPDSIFLYH